MQFRTKANMYKWLGIAAACAALILPALYGKKQMKRKKRDCEDGGVRHYLDTKAPKIIASTKITHFFCEFSALTMMKSDTSLSGQIYQLEAERIGDGVQGRYHSYDRCSKRQNVTFTAKPEFMDRLQAVVAEYDFARHNGYFYKVSGLPGQYGMELQIHYDSGEKIHATNNQSCFLPLAALEALEALFYTQSKK